MQNYTSEQLVSLREKWKNWQTNYENKLKSYTELEWSDIQEKMTVWVNSDEGEKTLNKISQDLYSYIESDSNLGTISHDRRHFVLTLYSALLVTAARKDWTKTAVIPSLSHDFGRSSELDSDHPVLSAEFLHTQLSEYSLPEELRMQMVYAVLVHQQGGLTPRAELAKITASSDREQLVGPEGVRRMLMYDAGTQHSLISAEPYISSSNNLPRPHSPEDNDLLAHILFFLKNLYPQADEKAQLRANTLINKSLIFIWLSASPNGRSIYFSQESPESLQIIENTAMQKAGLAADLYGSLDIEKLLGLLVCRQDSMVSVGGNNISKTLMSQLLALPAPRQQDWKISLAYILMELDSEMAGVYLNSMAIAETAASRYIYTMSLAVLTSLTNTYSSYNDMILTP